MIFGRCFHDSGADRLGRHCIGIFNLQSSINQSLKGNSAIHPAESLADPGVNHCPAIVALGVGDGAGVAIGSGLVSARPLPSFTRKN
jgi:hypothetical protein